VTQAFLGAVGNQAVGDGYTLTKLADRGDDRDSMLIEVGLREDARRVRCKLLYATGGSDGSRCVLSSSRRQRRSVFPSTQHSA
jgi:hypothetical protein